ncbi:MAG TPA: DivIVA domain-containing protein [Gaiellaceae bacterium]|jgi:cell division initiation protein|nr:DivIVA domain-containing protein [Gaiellaceae bacterium]
MSYSPVEIRHVSFGRSLFGYRRPGVDRTLGEIADSFESVWQERMDLSDRVHELEIEVARHREVEELLRTTLLTAERASQDVRDGAKRQAATILEEAHREARSITDEARREREHLVVTARRVRTLLTAALDAVGDADLEEPQEAEAQEQDKEGLQAA